MTHCFQQEFSSRSVVPNKVILESNARCATAGQKRFLLKLLQLPACISNQSKALLHTRAGDERKLSLTQ